MKSVKRFATAVVATLVVLLGACTSAGEKGVSDPPAPEPTAGSMNAQLSGPPVVILSQALLSCRPGDVPQVEFSASSSESVSAVATFVVGDREIGESEPFVIDEVTGAHPTFAIRLDDETGQVGWGKIRVRTTPASSVVTSDPVELQLPAGGCG